MRDDKLWPIDTDDDVERLARHCGWDNRKWMTPADYAIWCERMRKFAALAAAPAPVASAEDVERVAEALWLAQTLRLLRDEPEQARLEYAELDDATKGHLRWDARAALRAMGYEVPARD